MILHEDLLDKLFEQSKEVVIFQPPVDSVLNENFSITWVFEDADLPIEVTDYLFDTKLRTTSWKSSLKYVRKTPNKRGSNSTRFGFHKISGKITYSPSGKNYWVQVHSKFQEWNKKQVKQGTFFEMKSTSKGTKAPPEAESIEYYEKMTKELLDSYKTTVFDMSNIRPKGDALDAYQFVVKDHTGPNPPCAEIKMTEPQTCTLGLSDIKQSDIKIPEVTPDMKMQTILVITGAAGKTEFDMDNANSIDGVYAVTEHCMRELKKIQERRAAYESAAQEAEVGIPKAVIEALAEEESTIVDILERLDEVPIG